MRRYILRHRALEIYFLDGSRVFVNFPESEKDCEEVSQKLIRNRKKRCPNLLYHYTLDSRKLIEKLHLTTEWQKREMSTFDYLMKLNSLASRSYKDLTQYPVMPWIISDYTSPQSFKSLRDLTKTVGALGS